MLRRVSEVVAFSREQVIAMWGRARALRRAGYLSATGSLLAALVALALGSHGALACGVVAFVLGVAAALLMRRALRLERLSAQRLERLGGTPMPERTPSPEEVEQLVARAERKRPRPARTWRP